MNSVAMRTRSHRAVQTVLSAGNNLIIEAAQNTFTSTSLRDEKKSGIFSGGGLSITAGKQQQSTDTQSTSTTAAASTVGSIGGDVSLQAGEAYKQVGSDVLAPGGDISIIARKVDIIEARETSKTVSEQKFSQSGLTLAITSPVISAIQTAQQMSQAAGDTSDGRMQLLAVANSAFAAKNAANAIQAGKGSTMNGKEGQIATGGKNADGTAASRDATDADKAGGINLAISIGGSSSQSTSTSQSDTARGSSVTAGGNVTIAATGAGQDSNLTIQGSTVEAGKSALLFADNQIKLLAAKNESSQNSSNTSSSGSIGISFGTDGLLLNLSASAGKGGGNGADTSYTNTQVRGGGNAGDMVTLQSGGDTTLQGAVIAANQVKANVGGDLNIESLQDSSNYASKQQNFGGSLSIGYGNMSGSVSASKSNINSDFKSVNQQSGIKTGDGGFQVDVAGNTDLKGAVIASTDRAVNEGINTFTTGGTLTTSDIQNTASYSGKSVGISVGAGNKGSTTSLNGTGVGIGSDKGEASSTSAAGISGIAGNTAVRSTDAETGIQPIFDADKVQAEINAQVTITSEFNKQAGKAISDYASNARKALQEQAKNAKTPEEKAQAEQAIKDVNMQERALNILTSALTGMAGSVVTKEALSTAAEKMRDLMVEDSKLFAGVVDRTGKLLFSNQSGESAGVNGTGFKLGGTRADLDLLCGSGGERCSFEKNPDDSIDKSKPVIFLGQENADKSRQSYTDFLKTPEGQKMLSAPFGGLQGGDRTLFGLTYEKGSWQDKLIEAFAGPHDLIGGKLSGLYDAQGTIKQGMSSAQIKTLDAWSAAALLPAAPFAASQAISPEIWKAIGILLKGGQ